MHSTSFWFHALHWQSAFEHMLKYDIISYLFAVFIFCLSGIEGQLSLFKKEPLEMFLNSFLCLLSHHPTFKQLGKIVHRVLSFFDLPRQLWEKDCYMLIPDLRCRCPEQCIVQSDCRKTSSDTHVTVFLR